MCELFEMFAEGVTGRLPQSKPLDAVEESSREEWEAWDDVKNRPLDPEKVRDARKEEMKFVEKYHVYEYAYVSDCYQRTGAAPIDTRWIDTNKGDEEHPCYRSRWVAKDYRRAWVETIFSATPNIESVRLLLADVASKCNIAGNLKGAPVVMIVDIKRAYFNAPA